VPVLLPEPVLPEPVLPEPMLPEPVLPEPMPPVDGVAGTVELPLVEPLVEPLAPAPAPALWSLMHFSCSAPSSPRHLAGTSVLLDAPAEPEALVSAEPDVLPLAAGAVVLDEAPVEPEVLPLAAGALLDEPAEPEAPVEPVLPAEPDDCATAMLDNAKSVATVSVFNIMCESPRGR
jgi:hypothetical protein